MEKLQSEPVSDQSFEGAADAVVNGDADTLERLLREQPGLVHARSAREHRATLLHYVAANGVEDERQKTPPNAVQIAQLLLHAGADVDAQAHAYGGSRTTLELAATSVHPELAGVQEALLQVLLDHGAQPGYVTSCLDNHRWRAARFLARRGAHVNFAAAAALGELENVKRQWEAAYLYACRFGQNQVLELFLGTGINLAVCDQNGQTGLHWAVIGGHLDTVQLLLRHHAPLGVINTYGGTILGQALWSGADAAIVDALIAAGAVRS